jgi:hypothetical protein
LRPEEVAVDETDMKRSLRCFSPENLAWIVEKLYAAQAALRMLEIAEVDNNLQDLIDVLAGDE